MIFSCVCHEFILYLRHKIIEAARHTTLIVVLVIGTDFSRRTYAVERRGPDWVRNHERPETRDYCEVGESRQTVNLVPYGRLGSSPSNPTDQFVFNNMPCSPVIVKP